MKKVKIIKRNEQPPRIRRDVIKRLLVDEKRQLLNRVSQINKQLEQVNG